MMKNTAKKSSRTLVEKASGSRFDGLPESNSEGVSEGVVNAAQLSGRSGVLAGSAASRALFSEGSFSEASAEEMPAQRVGQGTASPSILTAPERIHSSLWRASQIARSPGLYANTGYPEISAQLPGGGWPLGNLIEVMTPRAGVGEIQLFKPVFCGHKASQLPHASTAAGLDSTSSPEQRPIVLIQPPYAPQACAWAHWGVAPSRLLWLSPQSTADALWAAEHILNSGAFAALVLWQNALRDGALRRLQLSAQKGDTLFVLVRALSAARQSSPAPLRLALHPVPRGLYVHIVKRRGSVSEHPVHISLYPDASGRGISPGGASDPYSAAYPAAFTESRHANMDSRTSATPHAGHTLP
ncbi:translesion DNA synthesis-associated protein ImuA [Advenella sp. FME57]|uniref:translesion DNA synthesis-associated protein ImuA n=1 Tax=Advenella sp. FME57 TaxID=2742604 RepID=UPI001D013602|nr:translesion DNA synthesis-associated protein ImuA [Advenella sp. FME57]